MSDLIQSVTATGNSTNSNITQNMSISLYDFFYCDLVLDEKAVNGNWSVAEDQHVLLPGREYRIRVSTSQNGGHDFRRYIEQNSLKIETGIKIQLKCTEGGITIKSTEDEPILFKGKTVKFILNVPMKCPRSEITLILYYFDENNGDILKIATCMNVALKGNYNLLSAKFAKEVNIDLNTSLPEHVAMLYVERQEGDKLCLRGWNLSEEPEEFISTGWRTIKLAEVLTKTKLEKSEDVDPLSFVHAFSRHSPRGLIKWLEKLLKVHGDRLCVVISEHNNLEIPWEILALDHENYLGAQAVVVRWKEVDVYGEPQILDINYMRQQGSVITYFNSGEIYQKVIYPEKEELKNIRAENYEHLKDLGDHLLSLQSLDNISLIYLGCHGHEGMTIESRREFFRKLEAFNSRLERTKKHSRQRPVVFVNACDSALLNSDGDGPMDVWLALLASSYIGTLGPIGSTYASDVAKRMLKVTNMQTADILRQLRTEAVQRIAKDKTSVEDFLYAFMYVYYGNPLLYLQLEGLGKEEAER